jgi:type I restriction enzyme S subunit
MKSSYKKLSGYIRESNIRNNDGSVSTLLGVNIDKYFMPSVANIVGTDLSVYKVVKKGQFACNRMHVGRDKRLPVALSYSDSEFIVSPAYDVFEIIDESVLNAEYLMMWFSRKEFDRNAWFYTDADVRGGLSWDAFCNMQLPVPDMEKQKEIVKEYHTIVNRIKLNEQLNQKLEETAQTIYKRWFVDFEFPDENGKPYKSNGGEIRYDESYAIEVPQNWKVKRLGDIVESFSKKHDFKKKHLIFFNTSDILSGIFLHKNYSPVSNMPGQAKKSIKRDDILYSEIRPANKRYALVRVDGEDYVVSTKLMVLRRLTKEHSQFRLYQFLTEDKFIETLQQSAEGRSGTFPQITFEEDLENKPFVVAENPIEAIWERYLEAYYNQLHARCDEDVLLEEMKINLLSKMTSME